MSHVGISCLWASGQSGAHAHHGPQCRRRSITSQVKASFFFPTLSVTAVPNSLVLNPLVLNPLGASLLTIAVLQTLQTMEHREAELADLKKVLGTMLVSGLAGRAGGRGAALATAAPMLLGGGTTKAGMSLGKKAGLAAL